MKSRTMKYMDTGTNSGSSSRLERNSRLYRDVYDNESDNLPIQDNSSLIDISKLRELVNNEEQSDKKVNYNDDSYYKNDKINIDDQDVHDINKLLEKARYENTKLKEPIKSSISNSRSILETLENKKISMDEIKNNINKDNLVNNNRRDNLEMTRELKYHTKKISLDPLIEQIVVDDDNSPLDLLSDLKPTGDTIVTKPIKEESDKYDDSIRSDDISDIDIIKKDKSNSIDDDFYTSSYKFSKKDFFDEDLKELEKNHNGIKILLLIILIGVLSYIIYYFVMNYGLK